MDVSKYNFDDYEIARLQEYRDNQPDVRLKVRDGDEITSPFVHLIFRPSLPDLQTQNPRNRQNYSCGFVFSDRTNLT